MEQASQAPTSATGPSMDYPRPQFVRSKWQNLNGEWAFDFAASDHTHRADGAKPPELKQTIRVPFSYQSARSGIGTTEIHEVMWYRRTFEPEYPEHQGRVLLHFGAVDHVADVWLGGHYLGHHEGGYLPFTFDITDHVASDTERTYELVVRVRDDQACDRPRGKQNWLAHDHGCWYTPVSGIWQTVWLEYVGSTYIEEVRVTPDLDRASVRFDVAAHALEPALELDIDITYQGQAVNHLRFDLVSKQQGVTVDLQAQNKVDTVHLWWPHHPALYDVTYTLYRDGEVVDTVQSYFGVRKVHQEKGLWMLNNQPYFQRLVLDQGYWRESLLTPPSGEALKQDIEWVKALGFNGVRKHQKIEDPRFYYWADKLGLLVWGELPSHYEFNHDAMTQAFDTMRDFITRDYNHPSIVAWVPLNESWGVRHIYDQAEQQQFAVALYHYCRALDPTRPVSTNDGWEYVTTDIVGFHDYTAHAQELSPIYEDLETFVNGAPNKEKMLFASGYGYEGQVILCSEYGGIAFTRDRVNGGWGYQESVDDEAAFLERYENITRAFEKLPYVQGYCYTQLTDVFHEVNGLLTMAREPKVDPAKVAAINHHGASHRRGTA